jgi:hypothetical protein
MARWWTWSLLGVTASAVAVGASLLAEEDGMPNAPEPRAIATGAEAASIPLSPPEGGAGTAKAVEVTVRPLVVDPNESYLVTVLLLEPCTGDGASVPNECVLGTFSFYPPPREGEEQTFVVPARGRAFVGSATEGDMRIGIRLVSANPQADLTDSALEVLGARLVE